MDILKLDCPVCDFGLEPGFEAECVCMAHSADVCPDLKNHHTHIAEGE